MPTEQPVPAALDLHVPFVHLYLPFLFWHLPFLQALHSVHVGSHVPDFAPSAASARLRRPNAPPNAAPNARRREPVAVSDLGQGIEAGESMPVLGPRRAPCCAPSMAGSASTGIL